MHCSHLTSSFHRLSENDLSHIQYIQHLLSLRLLSDTFLQHTMCSPLSQTYPIQIDMCLFGTACISIAAAFRSQSGTYQHHIGYTLPDSLHQIQSGKFQVSTAYSHPSWQPQGCSERFQHCKTCSCPHWPCQYQFDTCLHHTGCNCPGHIHFLYGTDLRCTVSSQTNSACRRQFGSFQQCTIHSWTHQQHRHLSGTSPFHNLCKHLL
mmetsp:Transcript_15165/g.32351  ORF Transcript_15165/g.32351 Transcript_15165/m.32351 type:complete len:207 (+) Transcript_15165:2376-2996(+)